MAKEEDILSQKSNDPVEDHHHQVVVVDDGCVVVKAQKSPAVALERRRACLKDLWSR